MKIYHKKNFLEGAFLLGLGAANLIAGFLRQDFTLKGGILCGVLFLLGGTLLARSLSKAASRRDRIEDMDERNQLVRLKSGSKAFAISQTLSFVLILGCVAAYAATRNRDFLGIIVGLGLAWGISAITDIFTFFYYESRN